MVILKVFLFLDRKVRINKQSHKKVNIKLADSKVKTTSYGVANSTKEKYCSIAFTSMVTLWDFIHRLKSKYHLVQHNKQYDRKVQLYSFHLNSHT